MRFFNKSGPVNCDDHYCLNPLNRFDLEEILLLIEQKKYFVIHAPRQIGKRSCLLALMEHLNKSGKYQCLYTNVESAQAARDNVKDGMKAILSTMANDAYDLLEDPFFKNNWGKIFEANGEFSAFQILLTRWCKQSLKPVIVFLDEVDALVDETLISLLRQLRTGYKKRPTLSPQSVIFCGVRDIRGYRMHYDKLKEIITGGSAFNIKDESLRLGDFTSVDVEQLSTCHTEETGQKFEPGVMDAVWDITEGQPWLLNPLGYEICFKMVEKTAPAGPDPSRHHDAGLGRF
ncbi:AAA-like domain-containing protein [Desulfococcaceae bacterium HSG7]|nr:AAA-like domain-containing protein [Desulfococcaceae bacterium HSG7]